MMRAERWGGGSLSACNPGLVIAAGLFRRGLRAVDQRAMFAGTQLHAGAAGARKRVLQRPQLQAP